MHVIIMHPFSSAEIGNATEVKEESLYYEGQNQMLSADDGGVEYKIEVCPTKNLIWHPVDEQFAS